MTHEQRICLRSPRNAQLITQRSLVQIQPAQRSENPWSGAIFCEPCRAPGSANEKPSDVQLIVGSANPQAYEIPRWVPAVGESVRDRPEVTPKRMSWPWPLTSDLAVPPAGTGPAEV